MTVDYAPTPESGLSVEVHVYVSLGDVVGREMAFSFLVRLEAFHGQYVVVYIHIDIDQYASFENMHTYTYIIDR
jgi:hypothetical protein